MIAYIYDIGLYVTIVLIIVVLAVSVYSSWCSSDFGHNLYRILSWNI